MAVPQERDFYRALSALVGGRRQKVRFRAEAVPVAWVRDALAVACSALPHGLDHRLRFYLPGPETVRALATLHGAGVREKKGEEAAGKKMQDWLEVPGWVVATYGKHRSEVLDRERYGACCCALQNLVLLLAARGVTSDWRIHALMRHPEFHRLVGMPPEGEQVVALLRYGFEASGEPLALPEPGIEIVESP